MGSGSSVQCKVCQCSQCQGDTEFYCNTCKYDLCLQCKESHVVDLYTKHHDVVIFREKYDNLKQETCLRHPDRMYKQYCYSCKLPVCAKCKNHRQHAILNIKTEYKTNREQHRDILHKIRSEALYSNRFLLADIKTDFKTCQTEIFNHQLKISTKAEGLKNRIDTVMCDVKVRMRYKSFMINHGLQQRKRILASIEKYEYRYEQSANRAVKLLFFIKNIFVPKIKEALHITQNALLSLTDEIRKDDVIEILSKIQITEKGKRQARNECPLELLSTPELLKTFRLKTFGCVTNMSCLNSDQSWISVKQNYFTLLSLTNTEVETLHHMTCKTDYSTIVLYGTHTVNNEGELIYINTDNDIYKLSPENSTKSTLIIETYAWEPLCVYSSPVNGNLLVGMFNYDKKTSKVNRYDNTVQHIQTIEHDNKDQQLYKIPRYITENRNGDVIVSDLNQVVVINHRGIHRFSYTGRVSGDRLDPCGICTDALSHILVCDYITRTIQMIDKDGHFLSHILTREQGIERPLSLSYDKKTHLLWVGSWNNNTVCVYRYINIIGRETGTCN